MKNQDWEIPAKLQPDPDDYSFDLERALRAVVNLKTYVPADAFTAGTLGTERAGSGVVIRESGLVATIGYLITEAEEVWLFSTDGRFFTLACDKLPSARGHGEPLRLMIDLDDRVGIVDVFVHKPGAKRILASKEGYGFILPEEEAIAFRRAGDRKSTRLNSSH